MVAVTLFSVHGQNSSATLNVTISPFSLPVLSLSGNPQQTVFSSASWSILASVAAPANCDGRCVCEDRAMARANKLLSRRALCLRVPLRVRARQ